MFVIYIQISKFILSCIYFDRDHLTITQHLFFSIATDILNVGTNSQPLSNWNLDSGYEHENAYPYHVYGTSKQEGVIVFLRVANSNIDHLCGEGIRGFKIVIHPPNEVVRELRNHLYLSSEETVALGIEPEIVSTSVDIRSYSPDIRHCFFHTERKLRFYKHYTLRNCENECLSNYTLEMCECVKFSMPRTFISLIYLDRRMKKKIFTSF